MSEGKIPRRRYRLLSERNSKLYDGETSKALKGKTINVVNAAKNYDGRKAFTPCRWQPQQLEENLLAIHESCMIIST